MNENEQPQELQLATQVMPKLEYRVYYDDAGKVLYYTTAKPAGNYIVVTKEDYALQNLRAVVHNGVLIDKSRSTNTTVYLRNVSTGVRTSKYDISVIEDDADSVYWDIATYDN